MIRTNPGSPPLSLLVLMPLRDDWSSVAKLIQRLQQTFASYPCSLDILIVDDGSVQGWNPADFCSVLPVVRSIRSIRLRRNLGHQRAIAVGLAHIQQACPCDAVLVMDADGEDTPEGALQLVQSFDETGRAETIFAERSKRLESVQFQFFYHIYRLVHLILTGVTVRVGNFSIVPSRFLSTLVTLSDLWNHYAAAYFRSGLPYRMIPIPRGRRLAGTSKMNFVALVTHGLSAISVFGDIVGVRLLIGALVGSLLSAAGIVLVAAIRLFTAAAIPGWATYATGTLTIILIQLIAIAMSFTFIMLASRTNLSFVPCRDYTIFVEGVQDIYSHD